MDHSTQLLARLERECHARRTEADLLAAVAGQSDAASFAELVRRYGPLVFGVCRRLLGHDADAEDAFQATFLILARKAGDLGARPQLAAWLHTVARRTALHARQKRRRDPQPSGLLEEVLARAAPDPAEQFELREALDHAVASLPNCYRQAVLRCLFAGCSRSDVAAELGLSEGTLSSRLARGRRLLRAQLTRRGITLTMVPFTAMVSRGLLAQTLGLFRVDGLAGSAQALPSGIASLIQGAMMGMQLNAIKQVAMIGILLLGGLGAGGWLIAQDTAKSFPETPAQLIGRAAPPREPVEQPVGMSIDHEQPDSFEEQLKRLEAQAGALEKKAGELREEIGAIRLHLQPPKVPQVTIPPRHGIPSTKITARVTAIGKDDLARISAGSDAGIQVGDNLDVYRIEPIPMYLGRIRIMEVLPDKALGRLFSESRLQPELGDWVTRSKVNP